jgi:hypothetical protein
MPFDQSDVECLENFIEISAKSNALYGELDVVHFVVAGDFNCQSGSIFYNVYILTLICSFQISKRLDNALYLL